MEYKNIAQGINGHYVRGLIDISSKGTPIKKVTFRERKKKNFFPFLHQWNMKNCLKYATFVLQSGIQKQHMSTQLISGSKM